MATPAKTPRYRTSAAAKARYSKRRARRVALADNDLTADQWQQLLDAWGCCAYCGAVGPALQKDCVLPISRGGRYTVDNVVPACASCNASKHNAEVSGWLRRKRLDEGAFLLRFAQVRLAVPAAGTSTTRSEVEEAVALDHPLDALLPDL